eukprot:PITA_21442
MRPQLPVQPNRNPNPNNKSTEGIEALTTFKTYLITPVGLNEIQLRSGRAINPSHSPTIIEEDCEPSKGDVGGTEDPPYPERLVEPRMTSQVEFDFLRELQNLHVRIPLLQALQEVPIYAKKVRDLCIKKPGRKPKDPATIHVMGKLFELMYALPLLTKYNDLGNPIVTVYINYQPTTNTLIDLGAAINVMTKDLFIALGL